jgi:hypothetical protein
MQCADVAKYLADHASACAVLPALTVLTPLAFSSALSAATALKTPRSLNELTACRISGFSRILVS